ncbi:PHP domain-containing protein, partial [Thiohalorhabdus sp.]
MHAPHLCVHSHYSFCWGVAGPEALAEAAAGRGIGALALTDINGVYGAVPFYQAARAQGTKPLIGARLAEANADLGCVVLARDFPGYQALCRLVTAYRLGEDEWRAIAAEAAPHLFFLAGSREWLDALDGSAVRAAGSLYARRVPADLCRSRAERLGRERLARYARARGIPPVASGEVTFVDPEAHTAHRVLAAMGAGTTLARLHPAAHAPASATLRDADHLRAAFAGEREAFANACRIASGCADDILAPALGTLRYPPAPLPADTDPVEELRRLCRRGLDWRYGEVVPIAAGQRLEHELTVIGGTGYASYFLVAADLVDRARARGVPTLGRGSAAGSLVVYLLGLTAVDPLKYGLSFERFMAFERANPPDIDLDFPWDSREALVAELFAAYGEHRVAMVGAFTTFEARGLVQEIGAALGLTRDELARLSKRLPRVPIAELPGALAERPTGLDLHPEREPLATILGVGRHLDGVPKGLSMHPCGLVIAPDRVDSWVPVERSAQGRRTTQFSMDPVEEVGLIKFDLIGNRALGMVRDTVAAVAQRYGETVDFDAFDPSGDPAARALMAEGRTLGCFYVESPSSRQILQRLDCRDFDTAVAATSIIRPGVSHAGVLEHYVARHRGEEAIDYPHPALREVLAETYGVLIYQEQLLAVMEAFAGIPPGEADQVRRSLTKKGSHWQPLTAFEGRFREGARARGHDEGSIDRVWRQIASFAGYSFCKSHSAAFIVAAWQG